MPGRYRIDVPIQICDPVPGIMRGDPEPDALPPDVDVRVMPYLACLRRHVHRQVHTFVIGVLERLGDLVALGGAQLLADPQEQLRHAALLEQRRLAAEELSGPLAGRQRSAVLELLKAIAATGQKPGTG